MDWPIIILIILVILVIVIAMMYAAAINHAGPKYGSASPKSKDVQGLIKFLQKESMDIIQSQLMDHITSKNPCDKPLGSGMMGKVSISGMGGNVIMKLGNERVIIPVVVKRSTPQASTVFSSTIINDKLYIYSFMDITAEAIILSAVRELWYKKKSPHIPLMITYGTCDGLSVDTIVTELQGMSADVTFKINYVNQLPYWRKVTEVPDAVTNRLTTMNQLIQYMDMTKVDGYVTLPNGHKCDINKLIDQFIISYVHTHKVLFEAGISLKDMHMDNIFIHWLNKSSWLGDKYIGDVKKICYRVGNKHLEIDTFGLILKIGDIGASIYKPRKDIYVLGQCGNVELSADIVDSMFTPADCWVFIYSLIKHLPVSMVSESVAWKFMNEAPYREFTWNAPISMADKLLSPDEILMKFTEYMVDKPTAGALVI